MLDKKCVQNAKNPTEMTGVLTVLSSHSHEWPPLLAAARAAVSRKAVVRLEIDQPDHTRCALITMHTV